MKNLFQLFVFIVVLNLCGCNSKYKMVNYIENKNDLYFKIDSSTNLYVRKLYLKKDVMGGKKLSSESDNPKIDLIENGILTEIQYLFFNKNEVMYISTVPSFIEKNKRKAYLLANKYPNSHFFNFFYFGTREPSLTNQNKKNITFKNRKKIQNWDFQINKDSSELNLISISNFKLKRILTDKYNDYKILESTEIIENALKNNIIFKKVQNFNYISFGNPDSTENPEKEIMSLKKNNGIYITFKDLLKSKIDKLYIPFDKNISKNLNSLEFETSKIEFFKSQKSEQYNFN